MSNITFSAFAWMLRTDAEEIASAMETETRSDFIIAFQALLAMAEE